MSTTIRWVSWLVTVTACFAQTQLKHPLPFEWPSNAHQVAALHTLTARSIADDVLNNAAEVDLPLSVDVFTFAKLEPNKLYLLAAVDGSGRGLYFGTAIVYCTSPEVCDRTVIPDAPPHNYSQELVDLDGNGTNAIVAKDLAGGYEGASSVDIFTYKIYKVIDGKAIDVSAQYKSYYKSTLLPRMKADLDQARAEHPDKAERNIIEALGTLAQDEYARRILQQPNAGLEHAKAWAHSGNPRLGDYALHVLSHIDSPESDAALNELSKSDDDRTAKAAAREIEIRASVRENERLKKTLKSQQTVGTPH